MRRFIDISGQKYGRLTVIRPLGASIGKNKGYVFECVCDCGSIINVSSNSLREGNTKSCGCLVSEVSSKTLSLWRKSNPLSANARRYSVNHSYFDTIDSEDKAYWLGFISADGNIAVKSDYCIQISIGLQASDYDHLKKFLVCLDSDYPIYTYPKTCTVTITSQRLGQALINLGITPKKSFTVKTCKQVPSHLERHYWRGLVDGDGCLHKRNDGYFQIELVGTKDICDGFSDWVKRVGIQTRATTRSVRSFFEIKYNGFDLVKRICSELYSNSNVYLERKYATCQEIIST